MRFDGEATYLELAGTEGAYRRSSPSSSSPRPSATRGGFRAFAAMHQEGRDDYTSGFNLDMGSGFSARFETAQRRGDRLRRDRQPDGRALGFRRRPPADDHLRPRPRRHEALRRRPPRAARATARIRPSPRTGSLVGARCFGFPPSVHGFLDGDILQVLVYDRALGRGRAPRGRGATSPPDSAARPDRPPRRGRASASRWSSVKNPPAGPDARAGLLRPGAAGRPVEHQQRPLSPRRQARRAGLRRQHLPALATRDGDGVEDKVELFWENKGALVAPIGMALTPPGLSAWARASSSRRRGRSR